MNKNILNPNSSIYLDYGYLMLPLSLSIASSIKVGSMTFFPKIGYHVSLIRLKDLSETDQKRVFEFAKKYPIMLKTITKIFRLVRENDQQSIIVRVRLCGLKNLISAVNHHFNYNFVYPPTHITLFTLKGQHGIGVNSTSEYRQLTSPINQKDSQLLFKSFKLI